MMTVVQIVVPALVLFTTLFGVLARGDPKPGGVALFFRVGLVGLIVGGALFYLTEKTAMFTGRPMLAVNAYRGLVGGGLLLVAFAAFGAVLKRRPS
jgi:hypothetical protein